MPKYFMIDSARVEEYCDDFQVHDSEAALNAAIDKEFKNGGWNGACSSIVIGTIDKVVLNPYPVQDKRFAGVLSEKFIPPAPKKKAAKKTTTAPVAKKTKK